MTSSVLVWTDECFGGNCECSDLGSAEAKLRPAMEQVLSG
jgi:hypothetical protein